MEELSENLLKELKDREQLLRKIHSKMSDQVAKLHIEEVIIRRILYSNHLLVPEGRTSHEISEWTQRQALQEVREMLHKELGPGSWSDTQWMGEKSSSPTDE